MPQLAPFKYHFMFTKNFTELDKNSAPIAGGKGASLGEMINAGIPVPPGFVVLSEAFEKFLAETDLNVEIEALLATVDNQKMHTVENASEKIQSLILNAKMPEDIVKEIEIEFKKLDAKYIAVRSSATAEDGAEHAWAGQLNSYLNTTQENLLENIQKCWASLFTPRAIFYRFEKYPLPSPLPEGGTQGGGEKISVAVVIQKMIQSEKSGIAFSVHPVTEDPNQLIIEAGWGLGEAIVSGSITPDSYVVDKSRIKNYELRIKNEELEIENEELENKKVIIDVNVNIQTKGLYRSCHLDRSPSLDDLGRSGEISNSNNEWRDIPEPQASSQVLNEKEILELSRLIIKIEKHYGFPCDIEWAYEKNKFYITQSRPITTLTKTLNKEKETDVLKSIKDTVFFKQITYAFIPVICFESAMRSYQNNPLQKKLKINNFPKTIEILTDKFEGWDDQNIQKITKTEDMKFVIQESRLIMKTHKETVNNLLELDYLKLSNDEFVQSLKSLDNICMEIYQRYIFFTQEFFETDDSEMIELLPKVRMELSEFVSDIYKCCDYIIEALAKRFDSILWQTFTYATFDEIIDLLDDPKKIDEFKKINGRSIAFIYNGKNLVTVKKKELVAETISYLTNQEIVASGNCKIIKGNAVSGGTAKGLVIKILEYDYEKINDALVGKSNYILVTPMTRPEIVSYLKNARAIITDEGGITCHAAIVSRELKIPCIVGTKIATQVLHDGDLVEVDALNHSVQGGANEGAVRILKKAESKIHEKEEYRKFFNRGMALISCQAYDVGERIELFKISGERFFMDPVFVKIPYKGTDMYFNFTDPAQDPVPLIKFFNDNPDELVGLKKEFDNNFLEIRAIIGNPRNFDIDSLFQLIVKLLPLFALGNMFGDERENIQGIKSELIDIYRKIRKQSDGLMQSFDAKTMQILEKVVPHEYAKYLEYLTLKEVVAKQYPPMEILKKRQFGYIFHKGNLHAGVALEEYATNNNYEFVPFNSEKEVFNDVIEGSVAHNGTARGFVKILFEDADVAKIKKGDILVASMTTPNFIVAMKKAAAFVTDEGGVTCHASIIARELKKPCIIGTKIATQVLHDGDLVEVDALNHSVQGGALDHTVRGAAASSTKTGSGANEGVVRILNRVKDYNK